MKKYLYKILAFSLCAFVLMACEKEEDKAILKEGASSTLSVSETSLVLTEEAASEDAITFSWTPVDYGFKAAITYSVEIDKKGNDFADAKSVTVAGLEKTFTAAQFNNLLIQLGLEPEVSAEIATRMVAKVSNSVDPVYSNLVDILVTPYSDYVEPGYLYVPGAYQGWDPGTAPSLISVEDDGTYVGYITFTDPANLIFKFTSERSWNGTNYGDGGAGILSTDGGAGNLSVPEPYTYQIEVNTNNLTWSAKKYSWAIIGDATPNGWSDQPGDDTDMSYNSDEQVWEVTTDLTSGELKFRLNDDWGTNYGDDDTGDNILNAGGTNIPVAEAGNYTITLNLQDPENPTYSITKN